MEINVHELRFTEKDAWTKRFNYVSDLYARMGDPALSAEERGLWEKEYFETKYCLEQGLPMSFIIDLTLPHPSLKPQPNE